MKAKLTIWDVGYVFTEGYGWQLEFGALILTSKVNGYASRKSAKRAAMNAARKLGLTVEEEEQP